MKLQEAQPQEANYVVILEDECYENKEKKGKAYVQWNTTQP